ncbi:hypothetical protein RB195_003869 [Necator americanus]|uniref:Uncharacterized protein n=1 Tax=Necator americanus TaxID=51031 RepID=A0ABR1DQJ0_NECAM
MISFRLLAFVALVSVTVAIKCHFGSTNTSKPLGILNCSGKYCTSTITTDSDTISYGCDMINKCSDAIVTASPLLNSAQFPYSSEKK